jgi:hypothetical protein
MLVGYSPEWRRRYSHIWLKRKLRNFHPDLLYSLSYQEDTILYAHFVSKQLKIPHILHIADSPFYEKPSNRLTTAIQSADECIAISSLMANYYESLFNKRWEVLFNGYQKFNKHPIICNKDKIIIRYIGVLHEMQHSEAIEDIILAIEKINNENPPKKIKLEFYGSENPLSWLSSKTQKENIIFNNRFAEENYESILFGASLLLLPITFNKEIGKSYRLSFPAKLPDYIASGKAILYYGPKETAAAQILKIIPNIGMITNRYPGIIINWLKAFINDDLKSSINTKTNDTNITKLSMEYQLSKFRKLISQS